MHTIALRGLFAAPDGEPLISESELAQLSEAGVEGWIETMADTYLDYPVKVEWQRGLTNRPPTCTVSSEVAL